MRSFELEEIKAAMERKAYIIFENSKRPYNLNLVGVRAASRTPNIFDDQLYCFWEYQGSWVFRAVKKFTTDPGLCYLRKPINPSGTAILQPGQYLGMWQIGLHRGKYEALVQARPCNVIRDYDLDDELDFDSSRIERGNFGINLHRALKDIEVNEVGAFSAGCQVFGNPAEFDAFMGLARAGRDEYGNSFSYTLLTEADF